VRAAKTQELLGDESIQDVEAGGSVDVPQPARLGQREPQTGHLHVFAMNAV